MTPTPAKPEELQSERIAGPYWLKTAPSGEHHVCGRNGAVMFRYAADQEPCATEHVRRLQKEHSEDKKRARAALVEGALRDADDITSRIIAGKYRANLSDVECLRNHVRKLAAELCARPQTKERDQ